MLRRRGGSMELDTSHMASIPRPLKRSSGFVSLAIGPEYNYESDVDHGPLGTEPYVGLRSVNYDLH